MAKGLRSSTKKANKAILRHRVFGPVEDARKERLSAKLLELASKSRSKATEADVQMIDGNQGWEDQIIPQVMTLLIVIFRSYRSQVSRSRTVTSNSR